MRAGAIVQYLLLLPLPVEINVVSVGQRWVQRYAPEINKRVRPHLNISGTSYRLDETYVKVGKESKYLYRATQLGTQTTSCSQQNATFPRQMSARRWTSPLL
jgi:hypothetical protein